MKKKTIIYIIITTLFMIFLISSNKMVNLAADYVITSLSVEQVLQTGDTIVNPTEDRISIEITLASDSENSFFASTSSGESYTILDNDSTPEELKTKIALNEEAGFQIVGWKVVSVDPFNCKIESIEERLPSFRCRFIRKDTTNEDISVFQGRALTIPTDTGVAPDDMQFIQWKEVGGTLVCMPGDEIPNITRDYTFEAYWVSLPPIGALGLGEYYLRTGVEYTSMGGTYRVNGDADKCAYQGATFYIPADGVYSFSR